VTKCGRIYKLTDTTKVWKERTIALQTSPIVALHYYKSSKETSKPTGTFPLSSIRVRVEAPLPQSMVKGPSAPLYPFALFKRGGSGDLLVRLASSDEFSTAQWVLALSEAVAAAAVAASPSTPIPDGGSPAPSEWGEVLERNRSLSGRGRSKSAAPASARRPTLQQACANAMWVGTPQGTPMRSVSSSSGDGPLTLREKVERAKLERVAKKDAKLAAKAEKKEAKLEAKAEKQAAKLEAKADKQAAKLARKKPKGDSPARMPATPSPAAAAAALPTPVQTPLRAAAATPSASASASASVAPATLPAAPSPSLDFAVEVVPAESGAAAASSSSSSLTSALTPLRNLMRRRPGGAGPERGAAAQFADHATARNSSLSSSGDKPLEDFMVSSLPHGLRSYARWMGRWRHLLLPLLLAFTLFYARDQLPLPWPVALACVGFIGAYTLLPPAVLGKSHSTAAAKLAIAAWSAPSEAKLYATLELDASAAIAWLKRAKQTSAVNSARGAASITLTHIVIKAVGLALHEDRSKVGAERSSLTGSIVCGDFYPRRPSAPLSIAVTATSRSGSTIGFFGVKEPQTKTIEAIARSASHGVGRLLQRHDEVASVERSSDVLSRLLPLWLLGCVAPPSSMFLVPRVAAPLTYAPSPFFPLQSRDSPSLVSYHQAWDSPSDAGCA
jgi:hypothetical protein